MQAKRAKWKELNLKAEHDNLVFLDESGVNINMIRRYGRAINRGDIVVMDKHAVAPRRGCKRGTACGWCDSTLSAAIQSGFEPD